MFIIRGLSMRVKKILNYVKSKVSEYPRIDSIVECLELKKNIPNSVDANSFIRSKNKINRTVETQAIKNINIDKKIEEYKKWQSLIKKELDLIKNTDLDTFNIVNSRFSGATFEKIENELFIGDRTVKRLYNDFIIEISFLAIKNGLIHI